MRQLVHVMGTVTRSWQQYQLMPTTGKFLSVNGRMALDALLQTGLSPVSGVCRQNKQIQGRLLNRFNVQQLGYLRKKNRRRPQSCIRIFGFSWYSRSKRLAASWGWCHESRRAPVEFASFGSTDHHPKPQSMFKANSRSQGLILMEPASTTDTKIQHFQYVWPWMDPDVFFYVFLDCDYKVQNWILLKKIVGVKRWSLYRG